MAFAVCLYFADDIFGFLVRQQTQFAVGFETQRQLQRLPGLSRQIQKREKTGVFVVSARLTGIVNPILR